MKFTDLNLDCLELVLEYLKLIDLLNVANSTKRLNKAAELVFDRKYGKKTVEIQVGQILRYRSFEIRDKEININDLKIVLQILRCFGSVISKIHLSETFFGNRHEINEKIVNYINKYCADYLEKLEIAQYGFAERSDLLNYFDRSFTKLTTLTSHHLTFTENFCLNRLFPKMRCLNIRYKFKSPNYLFYNIIIKHFPYLQELYIYDYFSSNEMIINLLQLNPQLRNLSIISNGDCFLNTDLIRKAVDSLQNVENFRLCLKPNTFLDDSDNIIRMKNVKSFTTVLMLPGDINSPSCLFPFSFENLEKFCIGFPKEEFINGSFNDQFYNFIERNSSITNLTIENIVRFSVVDWSRLAKSLPLLLEIYLIRLCNSPITADEAIGIISKFQMLKKFHFQLRDDYDSFRERLGENWDGTYETDGKIVKLNRKM